MCLWEKGFTEKAFPFDGCDKGHALLLVFIATHMTFLVPDIGLSWILMIAMSWPEFDVVGRTYSGNRLNVMPGPFCCWAGVSLPKEVCIVHVDTRLPLLTALQMSYPSHGSYICRPSTGRLQLEDSGTGWFQMTRTHPHVQVYRMYTCTIALSWQIYLQLHWKWDHSPAWFVGTA